MEHLWASEMLRRWASHRAMIWRSRSSSCEWSGPPSVAHQSQGASSDEKLRSTQEKQQPLESRNQLLALFTPQRSKKCGNNLKVRMLADWNPCPALIPLAKTVRLCQRLFFRQGPCDPLHSLCLPLHCDPNWIQWTWSLLTGLLCCYASPGGSNVVWNLGCAAMKMVPSIPGVKGLSINITIHNKGIVSEDSLLSQSNL